MSRAAKAALLVLLAWWTWRLLTHPFQQDVVGGIFMHRVDLMFHEAGHLLWSPFGEFMTVFGGTLNQCLVPIVCAVAFYRGRRDLFAVSLMGWWLGENLQDVGMYINDARDLQLQLLGGGTGAEIEGHDWEHLLTMMNAITLDHRLGHIVQTAGAVLMIAGLGAAIFLLVSPRDRGQAGGTRTADTRTPATSHLLPPRAGTSTTARPGGPGHRTAAPTGPPSRR